MRKIYNHQIFRNLSVIAFFIVIWAIISNTNWALNATSDRMWFATIGEVYIAFKDILLTKMVNVFSSFILILKATFVVIILGMFFGILIGFFDNVYKSLKWPIDFWRSIPPIIVISIFINLDRTVDEVYWRIWLVIFGTLPIMIMQIADAVNNSSKKRMLIFQSLDTSIMFKIKNVIIYEILPSLFSTTRTIISLAIVIIIVSEMLQSPEFGIGMHVQERQGMSQYEYVYAYAIITGIIGLLLNETLRSLEKKIISWE
jgi:ABC-type nitrate/sulfonate/bicarbonate transport system permease component